MRVQTEFPTIPLSGQVSDIFALNGAQAAGFFVPVVTSCQLRLLSSFDQTSANFVRTQLTSPNSGDIVFNAGPGSLWFTVPPDIGAGFGRLLASVAQAAVCSFAMVTKF